MNNRRHQPFGSMRCRSAVLLIIAIAFAIGVTRADTPPGLAENYLFVSTSEYDFSGGNYDLVNAAPPWTSFTNQGPLCADNSLRYYNGLIYLINRVGCDNIQIIDPDLGFATVDQFSTGAQSNPADICFVNETRAFITRYDTHELWEVDPSSGALTDTIDLSPFADGDGIPEMFGMAIAGGRLYVAIQRLDRNSYWNPAGGSCLAVIDLIDNTIIDMDTGTTGLQGITLTGQNPNCWIHIDPGTGHLLVAEIGFYGVLDGGIEIIDPASGQSLGYAITEETLGGDINEWDAASDGTGFACILSPSWTPSIVAFDLYSGLNRGLVIESSEYAYRNLIVDETRRQLFIADRTYAAPGVLVYNIDFLHPLSPTPIASGLYPNFLLLMEGPATGITESSQAALQPIQLWPQPAFRQVTIRYQNARPEEINIEIIDLTGRRIAQLANSLPVDGEMVISWYGTDQSGKPVPTGTYFARITTPDKRQTRKLRWIN